MCGIAGEFKAQHDSDGQRLCAERVTSMLSHMVHRGPDEDGLWSGDDGALGIRRLMVVDRATGAQPRLGQAGAVVVFNGEIYNVRELAAKLGRDAPSSLPWTEAGVIARLYEQLDLDFIEALEGMFALAIVDRARRRLVLARDRMGEKPLFYFVTEAGAVVFASTLEAIRAHPQAPKRANAAAIDGYLSFRIVAAPATAYAGIFRVEPGTLRVFEADPEQGGLSTRRLRYFQLGFSPAAEPAPDADVSSWVGALDDALQASVAQRLVAEVPVGAFLSGGMDSSLTLALMSQHLRERARPLDAFSVGFEHAQFDELAHASAVAKQLNVRHHTRVVDRAYVARNFERILDQFGEPFAFPSAIACYAMSELASEHVTVVLGGDGADELFAGYRRYATTLALPDLPADPQARARVDEELLASSSSRALPLLYRSVLTDGLRDGLKRQLYSARFWRHLGTTEPFGQLDERFRACSPAQSRLATLLQVDCQFWLPDAQLTKIDVASMAHSVELRSPFLDRRVLALAERCPDAFKLRDGTEKWLLRQVVARHLDGALLQRRKQELAVPLEAWLSDVLRDEVAHTLLSRASLERGYFEPDAVRALVRDFRPEQTYAIWTLYCLERWHLRTGAEPPWHD
jgi:asparagine synthase (glutamine-hydrolysing)